jgi:chorismate mutase
MSDASMPHASTPQAQLAALRQKIDAIDIQLVRLMNERTSLAQDIGRLKKRLGLPVLIPEHEKDVLQNVTGHNQGPFTNEALVHIYDCLIQETRKAEQHL